jgi:hypothetical protein
MVIAQAQKDIPGPQAYTLVVQWSDGSIEDMHFATDSEARAFVHAVYMYHQTGIGEEWHGDVFRILPRPFNGSVN